MDMHFCVMGYLVCIVPPLSVQVCCYDTSACVKPDAPSNGNMYLTENGSVATFECNPGYSLKGGSRTRFCDGYAWSGRLPFCRDIYPAGHDKRELSEHVNTTDRNVLYERQLESDIIDADDTCYRRFSAPPEIENGKATVEYKYNSVRRQWIAIANYTCEDEYRLEDKYQRYKYCKGYKWIGSQNPACVPARSVSEPCKEGNGGCAHVCVPFSNGRYYCECETGFTRAANPRQCIDVDECLFNNGGCEQSCNNIIGSYFCSCDVGYTASGSLCYDINECLGGRYNSCPGVCKNTPGSYECNCTIKGFEPSTNTQYCEDIDECNYDNGGCEDSCYNTYGSFKCKCFKKGFRLSDDGHSCEDVDECKKYGKRRCRHGDCINIPGSYQCTCDEGYYQSKNRRKCADVDECKDKNAGCQHICNNVPGNFTCDCKEGFQLNPDGHTCSDIDECDVNNGGCEDICVNTIGAYSCVCPKSLMVVSVDRHNCTFCDEYHYYDNVTERCVRCMDQASVPDDINGTSIEHCQCDMGFVLNGSLCQDTDECTDGGLACDHRCVNTVGSAYCDCTEGYTLVEDRTCLDIDECSENQTRCSQYCNNTQGGYTCFCEEGFRLGGDNYTCDDIDECHEQTVSCDQNCVNYPGGAACECRAGYQLQEDNITCSDMDECASGTHVCSDLCINTPGTYTCECSGPGFKLSIDKASCHDFNECMEGDNLCDDECINTHGSYKCSCSQTGFRLIADNTTCEDIDECSAEEGDLCEQTCINTMGSYRCDCNPGFSLASFHGCSPCPRDYYRSADIPECEACPPLSRTSDMAMTSISECQCLPGYHGNLTAGETCQKV